MRDMRLKARIVAMRSEMDHAEQEAARCRTRLHSLIVTAVAEGEPVTAVASASGYHRQRIFQLTTEV